MKLSFSYPLLLLVLPVLFTACSGKKDLEAFMIDLSEFRIEQDALKNGEKVQILGASGNLTKEDKIDFYNLVVVRSLETGDTVNVLVTTFFQPDLNDPETVFVSNSSLVGKLFEQSHDPEALEGKKNEEIEPLKFSKVLYDTEYIQVDVRKYPAVTGLLGDFTFEGDPQRLEEIFNK